MTEENVAAIEEEIFQIRAKLAELRKKKLEHEEEAQKYYEKRESLHARIREIKEKNAATLERVAQLRNELAEFRARLDEVTAKINEKRSQKEAILSQQVAENAKGYTGQEIFRKIRDLEQRIETEILRPEEEKRIYDELRQLNKLLAEVQKREGVAEKLRELNNSAAPLYEEARNLREQIKKKKEEIQAARETIQSVKDLIMQLKPEADEYHNAYLEAKKKAQMCEAEEILLTSRLVELQEFVKKRREFELRAREYMMKEKIKTKAMEKLSKGEKLSFEEMKLLFEDDAAWMSATKQSKS
ncbi:conserved hypothetical protein [Candidatus Caldarchaeum subterraneum]|uniref:Phosphoserine phosphatase n=1 Tax=Caldiarchaeum subterraneum TaxID=311458 RepID=E6N8Y1_CALS0|nr:conserved hypothetical protein [Candidatus Caldarchaeum subterraneum]BAJ51423.1 conserved hypothetical protein [Candidatus Caldarchaeum subterraneum]